MRSYQKTLRSYQKNVFLPKIKFQYPTTIYLNMNKNDVILLEINNFPKRSDNYFTNELNSNI